MTIQGCIIRAVALLIIFAMICSIAGAVKIQTERQYPDNAANPNSSPVLVGTDAFTNSVTQNLNKPYKTNSWLSPVLWADSKTLFYPNNWNVIHGDQAVLYQLPIYPVPWSLYYAKTTHAESDLRFDKINQVDPEDPNSNTPQGLFIRKMPIFSLYDTQQFLPDGKVPADNSTNLYGLGSTYTSPAIEIYPGFNSSHIRVNRNGDWDGELVLQASDDTQKPTNLSSDATLTINMARGSPFMQMTARSLPKLEMTFWHGNSFVLQNGTSQIQGKDISWYLITTPLRNSGPPGNLKSWSEAWTWENQTYLIFYPTDSATVTRETLPDENNRFGAYLFSKDKISVSFTNPTGKNYLAYAVIDNPTDIDQTLLSTLAQAAFCYPTGSKTTYQYSEKDATVTAQYQLETVNVLGLSGTPVQGLLPLHYGDFFGQGSVLTSNNPFVKNGTGAEPTIRTIKGRIRLINGNSFTCTYRYPGVLPYMPGLPALDKDGRNNLTQWMADLTALYATGAYKNYTYTGMESLVDTYNGGKTIWGSANLNRIAAGISNTTVEAATRDSVSRSVGLFFEDNPRVITTDKTHKQAPYYSYYDTRANSLLLYPAATEPGSFPNDERYLQYDGYGTVTTLNDHHYTYGYYVSAAALMAYADPAFAEKYKDVINQLIFDVSYDPDTCSNIHHLTFPKTRLWDSYAGHCQASGITYPYISGNSDESISEEIQFWAGTIRWGTATGQDEITHLGITRYTQAVYAYYTFWRDYFNTYQDLWTYVKGPDYNPGWVSMGYVPGVWDGKVKSSTFFGPHPSAQSAITILPVTSASFYHALDKSWIPAFVTKYDDYLKKWNLDPEYPQNRNKMDPGQPWAADLAYYGDMACWYSMADPDKAFSRFFPLDAKTALNPSTYGTMPLTSYVGGGVNAAGVYQFIRFMQDYGTPEPLAAHGTNTPYYMVFKKGDVKTYVGFNPTDSQKDITFNDSTIIPAVAPRSFGFWPRGYPQPIKAAFTSNITSASTVPVTIVFTDQSAGSLIAWNWSINGKQFSTEQNPLYLFEQGGTYTINLTVTDIHQNKDTVSHTYQLHKTGEQNGSFWYSTIDSGKDDVCGLYPSLAVHAGTHPQISYFTHSKSTQTSGSLKYVSLDESSQNQVPLVIETVTTLSSQANLNSSFPFGQSSLSLDTSGNPLIAVIDPTSVPQKLKLFYREGKNTWKNCGDMIVDAFPWYAATGYLNSKPFIAYASGNLKNIRVAYQNTNTDYRTGNWPQFDVEPKLTGAPSDTLPTSGFVSATTAGSTPHLVYYNLTKSELRHAWNTNFVNDPGSWTIETIASGVSVGWTSVGYSEGGDTLGICYYDTVANKPVYLEKQGTGSWIEKVVLDTSANITGQYCSLSYQAGAADPVPVVTYYDQTADQVKYAWRDSQGWHSTGIDAKGTGPYSSVQIGTDGVPRIAYHDSVDKSLKNAILRPATFSVDSGFSSDTQTGTIPLTVQFYDNTTVREGASASADSVVPYPFYWQWDFTGDGIIDSSEENPVYIFNASGSHPVTEWVYYTTCTDDGDDDCDAFYVIEHRRDFITTHGLNQSDFSAEPRTGMPPLSVQFTPNLKDTPTQVTWSFGDGATSTELSPLHTYTGIGRYTVTLETTGTSGSDIIRKPAYIEVNNGRDTGQSGMIRVHSEPAGADIYIDKILKGQTPADELVAKAGSHNLLVHLDGYQNWSVTAEVPAGEVRIIPTIKLRKE